MESNILPKKYRSKLVLLCLLFITPCLAFPQSNEIDQTIHDTVSVKVVEENGDFTFNLYEQDDCKKVLPSIRFIGFLTKLTPAAKSTLTKVALIMRDNPACNIKVIGHGSAGGKMIQQVSWDRVNATIRFLVERQGISEERMLFLDSEKGNPKVVDLLLTKEVGPNTTPAPHPNLRKP